MNDNHEIKEHDDEEQNTEPGERVKEGGHWRDVEIMKRGAFKIALWIMRAKGSSKIRRNRGLGGAWSSFRFRKTSGTWQARPSEAVAQSLRSGIQKTL